MCNRCHGLMVREPFLERITKSTPWYYCINCGEYHDAVVLKNRSLTIAQRQEMTREVVLPVFRG